MAQATPGTIKGIDPIFPRPEVTERIAFAPGIKISSDWDMLYISGISPYPPEVDPWNPGTFKLPADPAARSKMATDNLDRVLTAAGATWGHIILQVTYAAPGGGGIDFRAKMGDWRPCSTSLRVTDTGIPGANVVYQITAVAPRRPPVAKGMVPGIEPILSRPDMMFAPAVKVGSNMDLVYFSGMTAYPAEVDPWNAGSFKLPDDVEAQEKMAIDHIERLMKTAGIGWQHTVLVSRTGEASRSNYLRERLGNWRPAGTRRAVSTGVPGARVMYEVTAAAPRRA